MVAVDTNIVVRLLTRLGKETGFLWCKKQLTVVFIKETRFLNLTVNLKKPQETRFLGLKKETGFLWW